MLDDVGWWILSSFNIHLFLVLKPLRHHTERRDSSRFIHRAHAWRIPVPIDSGISSRHRSDMSTAIRTAYIILTRVIPT